MSTSDPKLAALEKLLAALVPAPGRIDRDQLLFRAGQASVRVRPWLWPSSAAFLAVIALGLGAALAFRPAPSIQERIYVAVSESRPSVTDSTTVVSPSTVSRAQDGNLENVGEAWIGSEGYLHDRNQVIRWGVDALPPSPSIASASETPSLESMLGLPEKKAEHPNLFPLKF
jgi:hypothetical protein